MSKAAILGSGRPSFSTTEINTARTGEMIQNDRRVILREISSELGLSCGSVQHIVSDVLKIFLDCDSKSSTETWLNRQGPKTE
ncbi:hypothetical protein TNCV_403631 [Trichonephila clavipes]|nr:hypothetical protein TNCV_403631 [Trichonephila clavipes]